MAKVIIKKLKKRCKLNTFALMERLKTGIIGCGALAEEVYLPLLCNNNLFEVYVVEPDPDRLKQIQYKFNPENSYSSYESLLSKIDAALILTPNFLHEPIASHLMQNNIHVFVEKPMAISTQECVKMIKISEEKNVKLTIGFVRRYFPNYKFIKSLISNETFGILNSFSIQEGRVFTWPLKSDSLTSKEKSGGGLLMDIGSHVLDLINWWIGEPDEIEYYDDTMGGTESECLIHVEKKGITGKIKLSRLRALKNQYVFNFEKATVKISINSKDPIEIILNDTTLKSMLPAVEVNINPFNEQLMNFYHAVANGNPLNISANEGKSNISLINRLYQNRKPLHNIYSHF